MTSVARTRGVPRPMTGRGLVLSVAAPGRQNLPVAELRDRFADHDLEVCSPSSLRRRVQEACAEGRPFVGLSASDAGLRAAAEELAHADTALLPIPTGPHDHFAAALGIETLDDAVKAADVDAGTVCVVDLGRVNGRSFVNNSSVGFSRGAMPSRSWRRALRGLRTGRRLIVQIDRRPVVAWLVIVGNGCYGERITDVASRESLDDSLLDVRVVRADHRLARVRRLAALLLGRLAPPPLVERRTCREITVGVRDWRQIDVEVDGETTQLSTPLRFESDAGALHVLVPK